MGGGRGICCWCRSDGLYFSPSSLPRAIPCAPFALTPQMLMGIVDSSVRLLNNLQDLVPLLIQLGLRHNAYKVILLNLVGSF